MHNGRLFSLTKGNQFCHLQHMDGAGGHYAKLNKPDTEGQILPGTTFMMNLY